MSYFNLKFHGKVFSEISLTKVRQKQFKLTHTRCILHNRVHSHCKHRTAFRFSHYVAFLADSSYSKMEGDLKLRQVFFFSTAKAVNLFFNRFLHQAVIQRLFCFCKYLCLSAVNVLKASVKEREECSLFSHVHVFPGAMDFKTCRKKSNFLRLRGSGDLK